MTKGASLAVEQRVTTQYEEFPYPARDPEDEHKRLVRTWLDNLDVANFRCFRGSSPFRNGFRVLVAGGGTGDSTIYLASQLRETDAQIVHLDLSAHSIDIARRRATIRGLSNIAFVQGSLLDLPRLGLGRFDFINCIGVLHHLADPDAGLRALLDVLADDGALALMVYALYGRTGVYQLQDLLRRINTSDDAAQRVAVARDVLAGLPSTNWFKRGEALVADHTEGGDAGLYDLLLHSQDRAYSVPQLYEWLADGHRLHLHFSDLARGPMAYAPATFIGECSGSVATRVAAMSLPEQQAIAELWGGDLCRHLFYATREADAQMRYGDRDSIPRITNATGLAGTIAGQKQLIIDHPTSGYKHVMNASANIAAVFRHLDGQRTFGELFDRARLDRDGGEHPPTDRELFDEFEPWFAGLAGIERMALLDSEPGWPLFAA